MENFKTKKSKGKNIWEVTPGMLLPFGSRILNRYNLHYCSRQNYYPAGLQGIANHLPYQRFSPGCQGRILLVD